MIFQNDWKNLSQAKKNELTDEPFSFRECTKCSNYIDLGGADFTRKEEGMYIHTSDFFCDDDKILTYEKKNNFNIDDNVFCWNCISQMRKDLEGSN